MPNESRSWSATLPKSLAAKVAAELDANESILWVGQPGLNLPPIPKRPIALLLALAVAATILAVLTEDVLRTVGWIVAGTSWFLVALLLLAPTLWRLGVLQRNYYYLLTSHRAIICCRFPRVELRTYTPAELTGMVCFERDDGSGDLRFERVDLPPSLREGFNMIEQVREVEKLVRQALQLK